VFANGIKPITYYTAVQAVMNHNMQNMNSQMMLDNVKSMMITMAMVKGTSQSDSPNSFLNTIIIMLVVAFIDSFVSQLKKVFGVMGAKVEAYIAKQTNSAIITKLTDTFEVGGRVKKSSIIVKIDSGSKNNIVSDALIDTLTHLPHTKCILVNNGNFTVNYGEEIEVTKGIYAKLCSSSAPQMHESGGVTEPTALTATATTNALTTTSNAALTDAAASVGSGSGYGYVNVYSYTLDMEQLRAELDSLVKNYLVKMTNKLGNSIYYFSEMALMVYKDGSGKVDLSKMPECLHFSMKQFVTNRSFKNLFGKNINVIRKRVEFFRDNKDWYDNKGIPYTLGILVSGDPGSGKTSIIKCIANELKRHIINIHLSDTMTKTQVENLFYNEQICVTQNGRTETYTIPINKRIYVLEDVDCQCDVILDRGSQNPEQVLTEKNKELQAEIERLQYALNEMASGKKMVMTNNKMAEPPKSESSNQNQKITLSFLLNLFDGVLETPGRITFMTTNFVDKLDKAFTRPGRIDVISKFGFADRSQLMEIIEHRYDTKLTDEQKLVIDNLHQCITPAEVGRILFENFDNLDGALDGLSDYANSYMEKVRSEREAEERRALLENNTGFDTNGTEDANSFTDNIGRSDDTICLNVDDDTASTASSAVTQPLSFKDFIKIQPPDDRQTHPYEPMKSSAPKAIEQPRYYSDVGICAKPIQ
jgi:hypothetical protein